MPPKSPLGGVVHTYQKYDPREFPSPTQPEPPDMVSSAFEHLLMYGNRRRLTPEQLAEAIRLDPADIAGLGPSLSALLAMLEERKRRILESYETETVLRSADETFRHRARETRLPKPFRKRLHDAVRHEQLYDLERLWYDADMTEPGAAQQILKLMDRLAEKYQVDELAANYDFSGDQPLTVPEALEVKRELEQIDELIRQLEEAMENAQIAIIDLDALSEYTEPGDLERLREIQQMVENYIREQAERQGLEMGADGALRLTPQAYRLFQGKLLERIFSSLSESKTGRHQVDIQGEGAVELPQTKSYEFGDSVSQMDIPQSLINAMLRQGDERPLRLTTDDIVVHRTRNTPKCATAVIMDMSGSMQYGGQYIHVKRMALALDGLIRSEYPGDSVHFLEMATFARRCPPGEIIELMPKPVTIHDPFVKLYADMSNPDLNRMLIPPHFTNIQHALQMSRRLLASQDTPNRQVILITDGLPTAHYEESLLYMIYPPCSATEEATLREGLLCQREGITINIFLIPSWSQSEEDIRFAYRLAESTTGRVFFTSGSDLDRYVVWDYVNHRRDVIG
ncbi:MAG: hypothetical protein KDB14_32300 [Planctomycetales bacterium]|nr:hypothetical protein [Planctomycetales bacterium]